MDTPTAQLHKLLASAARSPIRVLIAEDSEDLRFIFSWVFSHKQFAVRVAADGLEAVRALERDGQPDVLILDINMPNLSGLGVLDYIQEHPPKLMKVVVVTGNSMIEHHGSAAVVDLFLVKPIDVYELVEMAKTLVADLERRAL